MFKDRLPISCGITLFDPFRLREQLTSAKRSRAQLGGAAESIRCSDESCAASPFSSRAGTCSASTKIVRSKGRIARDLGSTRSLVPGE